MHVGGRFQWIYDVATVCRFTALRSSSSGRPLWPRTRRHCTVTRWRWHWWHLHTDYSKERLTRCQSISWARVIESSVPSWRERWKENGLSPWSRIEKKNTEKLAIISFTVPRAREWTKWASQRTSEWSEWSKWRANGWASGPVLTSGFLIDLAHCGLPERWKENRLAWDNLHANVAVGFLLFSFTILRRWILILVPPFSTWLGFWIS